MSVARNINEITQKEFQDYLKNLIKDCELVIKKANAKIDILQNVLWELDGYKIVEKKNE